MKSLATKSRTLQETPRNRYALRKRLILSWFVLLAPFLLIAASIRAQSALDGFDPNANGIVRVVVVQPNGKILIGGDFTSLSPNGGARSRATASPG